MGYSTTFNVAFGIDVGDLVDVPALRDEYEFDLLVHKLKLSHILQMDWYGDARIGTRNVVIAKGTERCVDADDIMDLGTLEPIASETLQAFQKLLEELNLECMPIPAWKIYGATS